MPPALLWGCAFKYFHKIYWAHCIREAQYDQGNKEKRYPPLAASSNNPQLFILPKALDDTEPPPTELDL